MKNIMKIISALLVVLLSMPLMVFAKAEDGVYEVIYKGGAEGFVFVSDSEYHDSDLFQGFKKVMPGDTREQTIDIINSSTDSDYIKLYLQAVPHDSSNLPQAQVLDGVDLEAMKVFLNQLTLTVTNSIDEEVIFEGSAGEVEQLKDAVYLGKLDYGDASLLTVTLTVPEDLVDAYSDRIGEIDWKFIAEQRNYPPDRDDEDYSVTIKKIWKDGNSESRPKSIKVCLSRKDKTVDTVTLSEKNNWRYTWRDLDYKNGWDAKELNIPKGYRASYDGEERVFVITNTAELEQTGQLNWPIPVLLLAGIMLIATGASLLRKGRKNA